MRKIEIVQESIEDLLYQNNQEEEIIFTEMRIYDYLYLFIVPQEYDKMVAVRFNVYNGPGNDKFDIMVLLNHGGVNEVDLDQDLMVSIDSNSIIDAAEEAVKYLTIIFNGE